MTSDMRENAQRVQGSLDGQKAPPYWWRGIEKGRHRSAIIWAVVSGILLALLVVLIAVMADIRWDARV